MNAPVKISSFLGLRTLILGDVNTGKTALTRKVLQGLLKRVPPDRVLVLDLAPRISREEVERTGMKGIGGTLDPGHPGVLYIHPPLIPPRLRSSTEEEAFILARENLERIREALGSVPRSSRWEALVINDLTLYLQAGTASELLEFINIFETVVANGYWGVQLGRGPLSQRERRETEAIKKAFDRILFLPASSSMAEVPQRPSQELGNDPLAEDHQGPRFEDSG